MNRISIRHGELVVAVEGVDRAWALRCLLEIPLERITGAAVAPALEQDSDRCEPSPLCGAAGHGLVELVRPGDHLICGPVRPGHAIVISLRDQRYPTLMVDSDEPETDVERITRAIASSGNR